MPAHTGPVWPRRVHRKPVRADCPHLHRPPSHSRPLLVPHLSASRECAETSRYSPRHAHCPHDSRASVTPMKAAPAWLSPRAAASLRSHRRHARNGAIKNPLRSAAEPASSWAPAPRTPPALDALEASHLSCLSRNSPSELVSALHKEAKVGNPNTRRAGATAKLEPKRLLQHHLPLSPDSHSPFHQACVWGRRIGVCGLLDGRALLLVGRALLLPQLPL